MRRNWFRGIAVGMLAAALAAPAGAGVKVQCPGDTDGDAVIDVPDPLHPNAVCMHLASGDGYVSMADGYPQYIFGFSNATGTPESQVLEFGLLNAHAPAPVIALDEGDEFYLTLTNVGMVLRPDLFDPHTVHWHGFPEASAVFDGLPDSGIAINMLSSLTYYYNVVEPGTYMYHCHAEATEHMQMGMLGMLYVRPAQNNLPDGTVLDGGFVHHTGYKYAYNDGDGSTYYDKEVPILVTSFDPDFHDASINVQPLPFAMMKDKYGLLNGRGYPDTVDPDPLPPPAEKAGFPSSNLTSQDESTLVEAVQGEKILLRISNLSVTKFFTLASAGIPMRVVGKDAKLLRGPDGKDLTYMTSSITLGGGESADVILDTAGIPPGTYFLYTTNLDFLVNNQEVEEGLGGMLTEIRVSAN